MARGELFGWARFVEQILDGRAYPHPYVRVGPTPTILKRYGLGPNDLTITPGKIMRISRDHPEITRKVWRDLPLLLGSPAAIVPSQHRDGSIIPVLVCASEVADPIFVPIKPERGANIVLSVYAKPDAVDWLAREIASARREKIPCFVKEDFAATMPKPGSASEETIPSSSGLIPADGTAKPKRDILSLRPKSRKS